MRATTFLKYLSIIVGIYLLAFVVAVIATILQRALSMNPAWRTGIVMGIIGLVIGLVLRGK